MPGLAQGTTYFLLSALQILYPDTTVITAGWFGWCLSTFAIIIGLIPNIINQHTVRWMLRLCAYSCALLLGIYWIWFPIAASRRGGFQSSAIFTRFYNGINLEVDADGHTIVQASDGYCWVIGVLFGAWEFYGYDASVHLAEETNEASSVVARGMWTGTACTWLMSIPTLALVLLCMQDFEAIVNGAYLNNWGTICHIGVLLSTG